MVVIVNDHFSSLTKLFTFMQTFQVLVSVLSARSVSDFVLYNQKVILAKFVLVYGRFPFKLELFVSLLKSMILLVNDYEF